MQSWKVAAVASAMTLAGVVIGAVLLGHREAQAQQAPPRFRTCFIARQQSVDTNDEAHINMPGTNRLISIPDGWTVVSGGGLAQDDQGSVILCR